MFYHLIQILGDVPGGNLFNYITFRAGGATMTALLISFILAPWMINTLRNRQGRGQPIRADGPASHLTTKVGTPTMGGLLILLASYRLDPFMGQFGKHIFVDCLAHHYGFGLSVLPMIF